MGGLGADTVGGVDHQGTLGHAAGMNVVSELELIGLSGGGGSVGASVSGGDARRVSAMGGLSGSDSDDDVRVYGEDGEVLSALELEGGVAAMEVEGAGGMGGMGGMGAGMMMGMGGGPKTVKSLRGEKDGSSGGNSSSTSSSSGGGSSSRRRFGAMGHTTAYLRGAGDDAKELLFNYNGGAGAMFDFATTCLILYPSNAQ